MTGPRINGGPPPAGGVVPTTTLDPVPAYGTAVGGEGSLQIPSAATPSGGEGGATASVMRLDAARQPGETIYYPVWMVRGGGGALTFPNLAADTGDATTQTTATTVSVGVGVGDESIKQIAEYPWLSVRTFSHSTLDYRYLRVTSGDRTTPYSALDVGTRAGAGVLFAVDSAHTQHIGLSAGFAIQPSYSLLSADERERIPVLSRLLSLFVGCNYFYTPQPAVPLAADLQEQTGAMLATKVAEYGLALLGKGLTFANTFPQAKASALSDRVAPGGASLPELHDATPLLAAARVASTTGPTKSFVASRDRVWQSAFFGVEAANVVMDFTKFGLTCRDATCVAGADSFATGANGVRRLVDMGNFKYQWWSPKTRFSQMAGMSGAGALVGLSVGGDLGEYFWQLHVAIQTDLLFLPALQPDTLEEQYEVHVGLGGYYRNARGTASRGAIGFSRQLKFPEWKIPIAVGLDLEMPQGSVDHIHARTWNKPLPHANTGVSIKNRVGVPFTWALHPHVQIHLTPGVEFVTDLDALKTDIGGGVYVGGDISYATHTAGGNTFTIGAGFDASLDYMRTGGATIEVVPTVNVTFAF